MELARDPDFQEIVCQISRKSSNLIGFPGDCAVIMQVPEDRARYMRLVTLDLWGDHGRHGYGLAEIQVYSSNDNVALGKPVTASDEADAGKDWSPQFITDGFTSRHPIIEIPEHLDMIGQRRRLDEELVPFQHPSGAGGRAREGLARPTAPAADPSVPSQ